MNVIYEWKKYTRIILKTEDRYKVENFPFLCNTRGPKDGCRKKNPRD